MQVRWARRVDRARISLKDGLGDFVSHVDIEAQEAALGVIRAAHPSHRILAEEGEGDPLTAAAEPGAPLWVVDPLDGTANFLHGHPMHAGSVAVAVDGRPLAGAVACPTTGERWWASRGGGAWKNGRRIRVSAAETLAGGLVGTGFPFKSLHLLPAYLEQLGRVLRGGSGVRRAGSAALDLCYLAEGRFDAFWELFLNPWDFAAGIVLIEEAGGVITGLDGGELPLAPGGVLGAGSPALLERLLERLGP